MEWQGSVPGKTFLFGEYLVLAGGPAVVLGTGPRFTLRVARGEGPLPFRAGSPAHHLYLSQEDRLRGLRFEFENPYGAGGFGASGAEFLLLARFLEEKMGLSFLPAPESSIALAARVLDFYYSFERAARPSSGSDVLTQWLGTSITYQPRRVLEKFRWPFAALEFSIFSTGVKVETHAHVAALEPGGQPELGPAGERVLGTLRAGNEDEFIGALRAWRDTLARAGFALAETAAHVAAFEADGAILARGCGALGADTLLVFHRRDQTARLRARGADLGLRFQAGREHLTEAP